jgi:hypothetical protein
MSMMMKDVDKTHDSIEKCLSEEYEQAARHFIPQRTHSTWIKPIFLLRNENECYSFPPDSGFDGGPLLVSVS